MSASLALTSLWSSNVQHGKSSYEIIAWMILNENMMELLDLINLQRLQLWNQRSSEYAKPRLGRLQWEARRAGATKGCVAGADSTGADSTGCTGDCGPWEFWLHSKLWFKVSLSKLRSWQGSFKNSVKLIMTSPTPVVNAKAMTTVKPHELNVFEVQLYDSDKKLPHLTEANISEHIKFCNNLLTHIMY